MTRVKRGIIKHKKRERILKRTKGFKWGRKSLIKLSREALLHAGVHAFRGRKERKRDFRQIWQVKINAAARLNGLSYSRFVKLLKDNNILLNRKMLAEIAEHEPQVFEKITERVSPSA